MAKALFGHVGGAADQRLADEVRVLNSKVKSLEVEVARLSEENERMSTVLNLREDELRLREPVYS